jgi:hypothetical protein
MGLLPIADVERLLAYASPETRDIVSELRSLVSRACLHATESILWGSLSYHDPTKGGRVKGAICGIAFRERPLRLTFIHGARLTDPLHFLQGDRLSLRHVEIPSFDRAPWQAIQALIREAAALDPNTFGPIQAVAKRRKRRSLGPSNNSPK